MLWIYEGVRMKQGKLGRAASTTTSGPTAGTFRLAELRGSALKLAQEQRKPWDKVTDQYKDKSPASTSTCFRHSTVDLSTPFAVSFHKIAVE